MIWRREGVLERRRVGIAVEHDAARQSQKMKRATEETRRKVLKAFLNSESNPIAAALLGEGIREQDALIFGQSVRDLSGFLVRARHGKIVARIENIGICNRVESERRRKTGPFKDTSFL
jgi:hypothetical protein